MSYTCFGSDTLNFSFVHSYVKHLETHLGKESMSDEPSVATKKSSLQGIPVESICGKADGELRNKDEQEGQRAWVRPQIVE